MKLAGLTWKQSKDQSRWYAVAADGARTFALQMDYLRDYSPPPFVVWRAYCDHALLCEATGVSGRRVCEAAILRRNE